MDLKINSLNFTAMHVNVSKMTREQRILANNIARILDYSNEYQLARTNNIDVYILPVKNAVNSVKIRLIDTLSDNYIRIKNNIVETKSKNTNNLYGKVDEIKAQISDVLSGKIRRPKIDETRIV